MDDAAECIHRVGTLPNRVDINMLEVMPIQKAFNAFDVHRTITKLGSGLARRLAREPPVH